MRACLFVVVVALMSCGGGENVGRIGDGSGALVATSAARSVVIIAADAEATHQILEGASPQGWWVKIEVPKGTPSGDFSLASAPAGVKFEQSYRTTCDPSVVEEKPSACWIVESYASGQLNLKGNVKISHSPNGLDVAYRVEWEGMTDRFGLPLQWYKHISEQAGTVPTMQIEEVPL